MLGLVTKKRFWFAAILGLSIFYYTFKKADVEKLWASIQGIDPLWGALALVASAVSYLCIAGVLHRLIKGIGHSLPYASSFQISLLSCTLNYVMAIGGLSGVAAKVYLLSKEKIPASNTLSVSMVHGFLTNTVAVAFIYIGFFFLYSGYKLNRRQLEVGIVILLIAFFLTWLTIQTIVHEAFRKKFFAFLLRLAQKVSCRVGHAHWVHRERAEAFFENFNESMNLLLRQGGFLLAPALLAFVDWVAMFCCLKLAFMAVRYPVSDAVLLVGFSVGLFTGIFSLTPASIGLMEGSMAGSFYLMGLDYDAALAATLLFRVLYYFVPILVSLFFYKKFFPSQARKVLSGAGTDKNPG